MYCERQLDLVEMQPAREALERILKHHEPCSAIVTDAAWNIVMRNSAASRIIVACVKTDSMFKVAPNLPLNLMRLMFGIEGLRPNILNWNETSAVLLNRLRREAFANPNSPSDALFRDLRETAGVPGERAFRQSEPFEPVLPLELLVGGTRAALHHVHDLWHIARHRVAGTPYRYVLSSRRTNSPIPREHGRKRGLQWTTGCSKKAHA
jgi:hypothetical protein